MLASVPDLETDRGEGPLRQTAGMHPRLHRALARHLAVLRERKDLHRQIKHHQLWHSVVTALPAQFAVLSVVDQRLARRSLLAALSHPTRGIGAAYMENAALCPGRVHRGQTIGRGAVRLHYAVAVDDVRSTAVAGHGAVPLLGGMTTEAELAEEVCIAAHHPDEVGTVVGMVGDLSLHHRVGGRGPNLVPHPGAEASG